MRSGSSSPSPAAAAPSSNDTTEVSMRLADEASELSRIRMSPSFQSVSTHRNEHLAASEVSDLNVAAEPDLSASEAGAEKNTRSKIFLNGYVMSFDKISSNGRKIYWRCAYKNTCKARLHTDINIGEKESIRKHNHSVASDDEMKLYGLDPLTTVQDVIYEIDTVPDSQELRNVRKRSATRMVGVRTLEMQNNTIEAAEIPNTSTANSVAQDMTASDPSNEENVDVAPAPVGGALLQVNPSSSALSLSGVHSNGPLTNRNQQSLESGERFLRVLRPSLGRRPRSVVNPTTRLDLYVAMNDGMQDYNFTLVSLERRDEHLLKEALEQFCGQQCAGQILFYISPIIRIVLNQQMISDWQNNQFFLLDTAQVDRWYLSLVPL